MENLDINTLEGWNRQSEIQMTKHLEAQGIELTPEAIQRGYDEITEKCRKLQLEADKEKERLKIIAEEISKLYMYSKINEVPMKEIQAICRVVNKTIGVHGNHATVWSTGAIYLYGYIQGKREARNKKYKSKRK